MAGIEYIPAMDLLEKLMMANASLYREYMMVSVKTSKTGTDDYFVSVPDKALLTLFDGFEPVEDAKLPKVIDTLHVADISVFQARFRFAHDSRAA